MKNQVVYGSHKQSPLRMSSQNQYENAAARSSAISQGLNGNKTFYQQNLLRNSSASQNIVDNAANYSFSKLNTRNISPNPTSENQALRSKVNSFLKQNHLLWKLKIQLHTTQRYLSNFYIKQQQSFGSDLKLQQIQFNYASPSQEQLKEAKDKESRAKSAGRNNIRARYISQNQKQNGNGGVNINNPNSNLMNTQILMNQLQSSTKNNEDDLSNMKKSQQYRIKQNLNSSTKNMIDVLGRTQMPQQTSTKNTNNINSSEIEEANHTSSGVFLKKVRNNSHGGGNLPFRNKISSNQGSGGSGAVFESGQKSNQSYHLSSGLNMSNIIVPNQMSGNISNNTSYIANMNQTSKNADNGSSFIEMNMDNLNYNNLTETQIRQTRINNLKTYIQSNYNSTTNSSTNNNTNQQANFEEVQKPPSVTKSPHNNMVMNSNQGNRSNSQKNPPIVKHTTHYGGYFQNNPQEKTQPLKALHNFTDSDIQLSSQKNTQELSSGRVQNDKDLTSSTSQGQKKININTKDELSAEDQQAGINDYLQNINNSLNYLKNIGQTYSTNTSSLLSQNLTEKEANIEEMHFYSVEFQQNCKRWLSHIEDQKI